MKRIIPRTIALAVSVAAISAFAETDPYVDYIKLNAFETSEGGWSGPEHWGDGTGNHPSSSYNYYVPDDKRLFVPGKSGSNPWAGGQLVIAGSMSEGVSSASLAKPSISDLVFLPGSVLGTSALNGGFTSAGISVLATVENPFRVDSFYNTKSGVTFKFSSTTFTGGATAGMLIDYRNSRYPVTTSFYANNFVNYLGRLMLRTERTVATLLPNSSQGTYVFGGDVEISDSAKLTLMTSGNWNNLTVARFGSLAVTNSGVLVVLKNGNEIRPTLDIVTSATIADGGVCQIVVTSPYAYTNLSYAASSGGVPTCPENKFKVATLSATAAESFDVTERSFVFPDDATGMLPFTRKLELIDNGQGGKDVYLKFSDIVPTRLACSSSKKTETPFNTTKFWTTWTVPTADFAGDLLIRHYILSNGNVTYPNAGLVIQPGETKWEIYGGSTIEFANIAWMPGAGAIYNWSVADLRMRGGTMKLVGSGTRAFYAWADKKIVVESALEGDGTLELNNYPSSPGTVDFAGNNLAFSGRLVLTNSTVGADQDIKTISTTLGAAEQWGGPHSGDGADWNAVTFIDSPRVNVTNDVAFTEQSRGFFVNGAVQFDVAAGRTLTLGNPVTYAGAFKKLGTGTLELSGPAQFSDGEALSATPVSGKNKLDVLSGGLRVTSAAAVDGLAVTFADGSRLVIDMDDAQHLYDVKCDTPLASTCADGKIPVEVRGLTPESGAVEITLCTVNAGAAASLPVSMFKLLKTGTGHHIDSIEKRSDDAGNVSYVALLKHRGTWIVIR